jgi:hypothetical protein
MKSINFILGATIVAMVAGCSTTPQVLDRVGPAPPKIGSSVGEGSIVVHTATETHPDGDSTYYYPHTSYDIYTPGGKRFKWVENHIGLNDESPTLVTIPAGEYNVHALSDFGPVIVPVLIKPFKTTEVNLDSATARMSRNTNDTSVVWIPKGPSRAYYVVGARAEPSEAENK